MKNCKECQKEFKPYIKQKYCCTKCQRRASDRRNKEQIVAYRKQWYEKNKKLKERPEPTQEEIEAKVAKQKKYQREYHKKRRETDPLFNLSQCLRSRINYAFKIEGYTKTTKTEQLLGADFEIVKKHLENLFTEGMQWDNHGEWEIDHIKPFASAKTEEELKSMCHYTNLQPLWKKDNREKWSKEI